MGRRAKESLTVFFIALICGACAGERQLQTTCSRMAEISIGREVEPGRVGEVGHFHAEAVSDGRSRERGLSGRDRIPEDRAMLFILEKGAEEYFWMKGMRFPLDMLFFDRQKKLTALYSELKPCSECPKIRPPDEAGYLLEINGGLAKKLDLRAGDVIKLRCAGPD